MWFRAVAVMIGAGVGLSLQAQTIVTFDVPGAVDTEPYCINKQRDDSRLLC
jgi:hypothetical protein